VFFVIRELPSFFKVFNKMVLFVLAIGSGEEALRVTSTLVSCCCCYSGDVMIDDVTQVPVTSPKPTQAIFAWLLVRLCYRQNCGMSQMISPSIWVYFTNWPFLQSDDVYRAGRLCPSWSRDIRSRVMGHQITRETVNFARWWALLQIEKNCECHRAVSKGQRGAYSVKL